MFRIFSSENLLDQYPDPLRLNTMRRTEKIMRDSRVRGVGFEELEAETVRCEQGREGEIDFAVGETMGGKREALVGRM